MSLVVVIVVCVGTLLVGENVFLNVALEPLLNGRPDRMKINFAIAWMVVPGEVEVRGLRIRHQGPRDQWLIAADHASGEIGLQALRDHRFVASGVRADGVSLRYRGRPKIERTADAITYEPPIDDLENTTPPDPDWVRGTPWEVMLDDVQATDVNEIWVGDYRLTGSAGALADILANGPALDLDATVTIAGMQAAFGDGVVATGIEGGIQVQIDGLQRDMVAMDKLGVMSARVKLGAEVQDLRFLDFYLSAIPWLSLDGTGHLDMEVAIDNGELRPGTLVAATFPDLQAHVVSNSVTGDGTVRASVEMNEAGMPESRVTVDFEDFSIVPDGGTVPLAEGKGFHASLTSPDVALNQPFTTVSVALDLPESRIPSAAAYNMYLPAVGISILGGSGLVHGSLTASSVDNTAKGELTLTGDDVLVAIDNLRLTADLALNAKLGADLQAGRYDMSGTTFDVRHLGLVDRDNAEEGDGLRDWDAHVAVTRGSVDSTAPTFLDASVRFKCSNSDPFVAIFASKKSLPGWAKGLLSVPDVSGDARIKFGKDTLELSPASLRGGPASVDLRFHRKAMTKSGELYASYGKLSLGIELVDNKAHIKLIGARSWFDSGAKNAPPPTVKQVAAAEKDATKDAEKVTRKEDRAERKAERRKP